MIVIIIIRKVCICVCRFVISNDWWSRKGSFKLQNWSKFILQFFGGANSVEPRNDSLKLVSCNKWYYLLWSWFMHYYAAVV